MEERLKTSILVTITTIAVIPTRMTGTGTILALEVLEGLLDRTNESAENLKYVEAQ
jgi:hypothetical protein